MGIWDDIKLTFRNGSNLTRLIYINIGVFVLITIIAGIGFLLNDQEVAVKALNIFSVPASLSARPTVARCATAICTTPTTIITVARATASI